MHLRTSSAFDPVIFYSQSLVTGTGQSITVITRPNNPSGEMIPLQSLINIIETARDNNGWVFLDEAYIQFSELSSDGNSAENNEGNSAENNEGNNVGKSEANNVGKSEDLTTMLLQQFDNLVILKTLSKALGLPVLDSATCWAQNN